MVLLNETHDTCGTALELDLEDPVMTSCTGGGDLMLRFPQLAGETCPPGATGSCRVLRCQAGNMQSLSAPAGESLMLICRDPSLEPAVLTLTR